MADESSRTRLLAAAERLIIDEGLKALTIRRVAAATGLNSALITYYFGGMEGLLRELGRVNLEPLLAQWSKSPDAGGGLDGVLRGYFAPMWAPAHFCTDERAIVLLDEIVAHGEPGIRDDIARSLIPPFQRALQALSVLVPQLPSDEAAARLSFATAGALGMPPRSRARALFSELRPRGGLEDALRFAKALFA